MEQRLILGSPGTGKTTRLLEIVKEELAAGVSPRRIAYLSFTKKAVEEATERACSSFGYSKDDLPYFRTLHSLCFQLLRLRRGDVMQRADYLALGEELGYEFGRNELNPEDGFPVGGDEGDRLLFVLGLARNRCVTLDEQWHALNDPTIDLFALRRLDAALSRYKVDISRLDFTDMLERILKGAFRADIDVVVIDEAQDLSNLQWQVCRQLFPSVQRMYIGGDDDQAIYRWSGADVETFLALDGQQEVLRTSYRLPRSVYLTARRVIEGVRHRFQKQWQPRDEEGAVQNLPTIETMDFEAPGSWMVVARSGYMLAEAEEMLRKRGVIYTTRKGVPSVAYAHFAAIKAWERLRAGQAQGGREVRRIYDYLRPGSGVARGAKGAAEFHPDETYAMEELRGKFGLLATGIWHDALEGIPLDTREYYLGILRAGRKLHTPPQIKLGTIHSAKGGEADNVALLLDMSQKTFQGYQQYPDDERRVFYVGMTRAKHNLFLLDAKSPQSFVY